MVRSMFFSAFTAPSFIWKVLEKVFDLDHDLLLSW